MNNSLMLLPLLSGGTRNRKKGKLEVILALLRIKVVYTKEGFEIEKEWLRNSKTAWPSG